MSKSPKIADTAVDIIICPQCESRQEVEVPLYEGAPWWALVHTCVKCEYVIMESDWESESGGVLRGTWDNDPTAGELTY